MLNGDACHHDMGASRILSRGETVCWQRVSQGEAFRQFEYRLEFNPFKTTFTEYLFMVKE
jgi:hypothetical protein